MAEQREIVISKTFEVSPHVLYFQNSVYDKLTDLNLKYDYNEEYVTIHGEESSVNQMIQFVNDLCTSCLAQNQQNIEVSSRGNDDAVHHEFQLSRIIVPHLKEIQIKAEEYKLNNTFQDGQLFVSGQQGDILSFLTWLYTFTVEAYECEDIEPKEIRADDQNQQQYRSEIALSNFHRSSEEDIMKKLVEYKLEMSEVGYDILSVQGRQQSITEFKSFLFDAAFQAKKALYPKYWDFTDKRVVSEIEVHPDSAEFSEVAAIFLRSLNNVNHLKINRIQNKYLMEHYITTLQKRQELRSDSHINRLPLFHGTRGTNPQQIYYNSDTGFDLQFSRTTGLYGNGIYFAGDSSYSHKSFAYKTDDGRLQMFLADVFIGNSYQTGANSRLIKAPNGYDSVTGQSGIYLIYNNFHSYPLYLIEYSTEDHQPSIPYITYVNQINNKGLNFGNNGNTSKGCFCIAGAHKRN